MSRIAWWAPALLIVAGLMVSQSAFAAPGRGGGGGGHSSGGHSSGGHSSAHMGNYNHNNNHNHNHNFSPFFLGGYYPYLGYNSYSNSYYYTPDYYYPPTYSFNNGPNYNPNVPYPPQMAPRVADSAVIQVILPDAEARLWFDGKLTTQTGTERYFHTPDLKTGAAYNYQIRVVWTKDGRELSEERTVSVTPGQTTLVYFTR